MSVESAQHAEYAATAAARSKAPAGRRSLGRASGFIGDRLIVDLYAALELLAIIVAGFAIAEFYVGGRLEVSDYYRDYAGPILIGPLIVVTILRHRGEYEFVRLCRFATSMGPVTSGIATAFALLIIVGFVARIANDFSRIWFVGWFGTTITLVLALRAIASPMFTRLAEAGFIQKTVVIYGQTGLVDAVAAEIKQARLGIRLAGTFGPGPKSENIRPGLDSGDLKDLIAFAQTHTVDTIILALPLISAQRLKDILTVLSVLPAEIKLYPALKGGRIPMRGMSMLDRLPLIDLQHKPISEWGLIAKTIEDYVVATTALLVLAPLFAVIAVAIKLDSRGPVFFVQRRHGFNHKIIRVWKFRTMRVMEDGDKMVQATRGDDRITWVGGLLRRTSFDELPQLFNVLMGNMSVVGPRPHPLALNSRYSGLLARYETRYRVKPGITGWAQINGYRGPTEDPELMRKRIEFDVEYIENWSLWTDLKIIAATPFVGLIHRNAL